MTTGGQPTATAAPVELRPAWRAGAGIEKVLEPRDEAELGHAFDRMLAEDGALRRSREDPAGPGRRVGSRAT